MRGPTVRRIPVQMGIRSRSRWVSLAPLPPAPDLADYIDLALQGGFPDAAYRLQGKEGSQEWLESYIDELLTRDVAGLDNRDPTALARYFEVLALNTAGLAHDTTLSVAAHIDRKTAAAYDALMENLLVLQPLHPWLTNRLSRLVKSPKRYLVDPSLVGAALRLDRQAVLRDGDLLGRLLDTFVAAQLRPEAAVGRRRPRLYHLRDKNGRHEVDLIAELSGDRVVALEVKSTASPNRGDGAHLIWLRDQLGDRFLAGAVLHTGPLPFTLEDRIFAIPIASLWAPREA